MWLAGRFVYVFYPALVAFHLGGCVVAVGFRLGGNGELGYLLRGLVSFYPLACPLDVEHKRMLDGLVV